MDFAWLLQSLLNGLSIGSVYAVFALGYTLVFSILGIINFAHGAVFTLGAYLTYALAVGRFGIEHEQGGTQQRIDHGCQPMAGPAHCVDSATVEGQSIDSNHFMSDSHNPIVDSIQLVGSPSS